jgi:hypothetical protein
MTAIPHPTTMKAATPDLSTLKQTQNCTMHGKKYAGEMTE